MGHKIIIKAMSKPTLMEMASDVATNDD